MTDVIRHISNNHVAGSGSKPAAKPSDEASSQASNASSAATGQSVDQVEITDTAKKVEQVISSLSSEPIVDRQKVDEIKSALAEGRYEVNSADIANKLIEVDELLK